VRDRVRVRSTTLSRMKAWGSVRHRYAMGKEIRMEMMMEMDGDDRGQVEERDTLYSSCQMFFGPQQT
jgi:hypothetical protein